MMAVNNTGILSTSDKYDSFLENIRAQVIGSIASVYFMGDNETDCTFMDSGAYFRAL